MKRGDVVYYSYCGFKDIGIVSSKEFHGILAYWIRELSTQYCDLGSITLIAPSLLGEWT